MRTVNTDPAMIATSPPCSPHAVYPAAMSGMSICRSIRDFFGSDDRLTVTALHRVHPRAHRCMSSRDLRFAPTSILPWSVCSPSHTSHLSISISQLLGLFTPH